MHIALPPPQNRVAVSIQLLNANASNSGTRASANLTAPNPNSNAPTTVNSLNGLSSPVNKKGAASAGNMANSADLPPRVLIVTQQGGMLIVDIEGFQLRSVGFYTVKVTCVSFV